MNSALWRQIANDLVVKWVSEGVPVLLNEQLQSFYYQNHVLTNEQFEFVDKEIRTLLLNGAVEEINYQPICVSGLSTVPKKGESKFRLIHDLRGLNAACCGSSFQYEDIRSVRSV